MLEPGVNPSRLIIVTCLEAFSCEECSALGELAGATVFLASEKASSFVTGTDIRVDGGFLSQTI